MSRSDNGAAAGDRGCVLVAGWFSFDGMGATAGDLLARNVVVDWLQAAGMGVEVAVAAPFVDGHDWKLLDPHRYSAVVFVCGPFGNGPPVTEFLERFQGTRLVGIDLSMLDSISRWNPFDVLFERDSDRASRPDLVFAAPVRLVPVVGVMQVHRQREYGARGRHAEVADAIQRLFARHEMARIDLDTRLDVPNPVGGIAAIESVIARLDAIVTSRLHGLVLGLRNGIPVLAIDPIDGGAKVTSQATVLGWKACVTGELRDGLLDDLLDYCLSPEARADARAAAARGRDEATRTGRDFVAAVARLRPGSGTGAA